MGKKRAVKKKKRKLKPVPPAPYTEEQYWEAVWFYLERDQLSIFGGTSTITNVNFDDDTRRLHRELGDGLGASVCILGDCFITDDEVAWYFENERKED